MVYQKSDIDALLHALVRQWGGQVCDWWLVVHPTWTGGSASVELEVEIAFGGTHKTIAVSLADTPCHDKHAFGRTGAGAGLPDAPAWMRSETLAAVRRASIHSLCARCTGNDIEPLLGYLRCCGVLVTD